MKAGPANYEGHTLSNSSSNYNAVGGLFGQNAFQIGMAHYNIGKAGMIAGLYGKHLAGDSSAEGDIRDFVGDGSVNGTGLSLGAQEGVTADAAKARINNFIDNNPSDAVIPVASADFQAIMGEDLAFVASLDIAGMGKEDFRIAAENADGFFFGQRYRARSFKIEGFYGGARNGSDINYYVVGSVIAARGYSLTALRGAVGYHNLRAITRGEPIVHNLSQTFNASRAFTFARMGYETYNATY